MAYWLRSPKRDSARPPHKEGRYRPTVYAIACHLFAMPVLRPSNKVRRPGSTRPERRSLHACHRDFGDTDRVASPARGVAAGSRVVCGGSKIGPLINLVGQDKTLGCRTRVSSVVDSGGSDDIVSWDKAHRMNGKATGRRESMVGGSARYIPAQNANVPARYHLQRVQLPCRAL